MWARRRFKQTVRKHVVLHLREGYSLDGVLAGIYADGVQLDGAKFVRAESADVALDGVQLVPWESLSWVQELIDVAGPSATE
jgi:hypothetical protein